MTELRAAAESRHRDPTALYETVTAQLATIPPDSLEFAVAHWVLGLACHERGAPRDAIRHFRTGLRHAARHGHAGALAPSRASLAVSLMATGDTAGARRELALARAAATGADADRVEALWGVLLQRTGRLAEALAVFDEVAPRLRRLHDHGNLARLLVNRGALHTYQCRFARATADLVECERICRDHDLPVLGAMAAHNLGFLSGRTGDVRAGLAGFDRARTGYHAVGDPPRQVAVLEADRAELLMQAGLAGDARRGLERAVALLDRVDPDAGVVDRAHQAEVRLLLAQALLAEGRPADADDVARTVAATFRSAHRSSWAAQADYVSARAQVAAVEDDVAAPPGLLRRTRRIARTLDRLGWTTEAEHVRTLLGRVALSLGRPDVVVAELGGRDHPARGGTVEARTTALYAAALHRLARGDRPGAKSALRQGLQLVDRHRATLTATELRAGAGARATELARLGLRLALADGRPAEVLRWAERWRAGSLRLPPVRPPADPVLAGLTAELVEARAEQRDAALAGRAVAARARTVARLERAVRERALVAPGTPADPPAALDLPALRRALGPAVLVEYVALERRLWAVTVAADGQRLHDLGPLAPVLAEAEFLLAAQRRRALTARVRGATATARRDVAGPPPAAARLDRLLLAALDLPPGAPLVVVPTGGLHGLTWATLPGIRGRPLVVAPSADLWVRRGRPARTDAPPAALIAGPELPGAVDEVGRLAAVVPGATVLTGADASVAATLDALEHRDLVHIAAHGQFRADSPLFSSLLLADGPLTVVDMERLDTAATTVVLPACDAARTDVRAGDELIGTTTALLARGVRTVVAPAVPVADGPTATFMVAFHERLRDGHPPSAALALATLDVGADVSGAATSFVCVGAAGS